ncbi:MAG: acetyl-CoA carboxylase, biotin carboxyl carrier protein [Lachnospiraceae bacterium]|nr:acetyl-CoA carboxylase, biotin carboxyl carrier protein [Lachnospiraceae bacterium]
MNETDIRKYAGLMEELGLTGLEITEGDKVVRLERSAHAVIKEQETFVRQENAGEDGGDYVSVTSPIIGVFYAAPAENADPFVAVGDRVEPGSVLCVIEAMKLMNEIRAESGGVIEKICATNGQVVEYGTELFRIRR